MNNAPPFIQFILEITEDAYYPHSKLERALNLFYKERSPNEEQVTPAELQLFYLGCVSTGYHYMRTENSKWSGFFGINFQSISDLPEEVKERLRNEKVQCFGALFSLMDLLMLFYALSGMTYRNGFLSKCGMSLKSGA
jgi:hypothetical protein